MKRKTVLYGLIVMAVAFCLMACPSWKTQQTVVTGYEITGTSLGTVGDIVMEAYKTKMITAEQYTQIRGIYNKAVASYILAGTVQKAWLNTTDAVQKKALLEKYTQLFDEYQKLVLDVVNLASSYGLNILGGK